MNPEEWPKNKRWVVNRLMFLWDMETHNVVAYMRGGFQAEVDALQKIRGLPEFAFLRYFDSPYGTSEHGDNRFLTNYFI